MGGAKVEDDSAFFFIILTVSTGVLLCPTSFGFPQKGDWATYSALAVCHTDATDEKVQEQIEYYRNINNTKWNLTIQELKYPNVTILITKNLENGTTVLESQEGNVETGNPDLNMWMVSANLSVGDPIYKRASDPNKPLINETDKLEFANATRDVVIAQFSQQESDTISTFWAFWDKETGVLCGMISTMEHQGEDFMFKAEVHMQIVETNLWSKNDSGHNESTWPATIMLVVIFLILIVIIVLFRRRKRKRKVGLHR